MSTYKRITDEVPTFVTTGAGSNNVHIPVFDDPTLGNEPICDRIRMDTTLKRWKSSSYPEGTKEICGGCMKWWEMDDRPENPRIHPEDYKTLIAAHNVGYFEGTAGVLQVSSELDQSKTEVRRRLRRALKYLAMKEVKVV